MAVCLRAEKPGEKLLHDDMGESSYTSQWPESLPDYPPELPAIKAYQDANALPPGPEKRAALLSASAALLTACEKKLDKIIARLISRKPRSANYDDMQWREELYTLAYEVFFESALKYRPRISTHTGKASLLVTFAAANISNAFKTFLPTVRAVKIHDHVRKVYRATLNTWYEMERSLGRAPNPQSVVDVLALQLAKRCRGEVPARKAILEAIMLYILHPIESSLQEESRRDDLDAPDGVIRSAQAENESSGRGRGKVVVITNRTMPFPNPGDSLIRREVKALRSNFIGEALSSICARLRDECGAWRLLAVRLLADSGEGIFDQELTSIFGEIAATIARLAGRHNGRSTGRAASAWASLYEDNNLGDYDLPANWAGVCALFRPLASAIAVAPSDPTFQAAAVEQLRAWYLGTMRHLEPFLVELYSQYYRSEEFGGG